MGTIDCLNDEDLIPTRTTRHGRAEYRIRRDLVFGKLTVPKGFVTDKYSLPGRVIPFIWQPKKAKYATAAVVHDWLYETAWFGPGEDGRKKADEVLMRVMTATGINVVKRWIVWAAVRVGGRWGYGIVDPDNVELVHPVRPDLKDVLS